MCKAGLLPEVCQNTVGGKANEVGLSRLWGKVRK